MKNRPSVKFAGMTVPKKGSVLVLAAQKAKLGPLAKDLDTAAALTRAFGVAEFSGKFGAVVDVLAPAGSDLDSIVAVGVGDPEALDEFAWMKLGGVISGHFRRAGECAIVLDLDGRAVSGVEAANLAAGMLLRAYGFDKYKTRNDSAGKADASKRPKFTILCAEPTQAKRAFVVLEGLADGVDLARDLVNEPANMLGPVEFGERARELTKLGVKVEILGEKEMKKLGMGALLGVNQGSVRPPCLAVMQWRGGNANEPPVAFVGKGVVFDTGGNSIKPASSMEDMRGDVGGAAAVVGAMHAIAARKAKANVIGIIGCVENMVDGNAQRPGDIVTSMSGQTIEVLNTDAEGRLVLADAMWYCQQKFKPKAMIDLATLTGAIMVALGQHHAGLFSNDDALAGKLTAAGLATQERVWRMPLGPEYDKLIDSKNADMKNIGGRHGGAISAAQFLQRFVKDTPWAHLDIAGTALAAPASEINQSWASGFGVRLLDRLVRDNYES
ncbi:leucyl aminopeptidase [Arvimicrobium flavum]|uniref:leucyl aminopeptidase n=1 Tax=Arvimicrobium flavum TaxID=3393320 RepID=UPI00237B0B01|nr:leucyl aminopeptidase [Mesorhizobium shangrilense]